MAIYAKGSDGIRRLVAGNGDGDMALMSPRHYIGEATIPTRATDVLAPSWEGKTTVTGTPGPNNPATITGVSFAATATGPDGQTRSVDLGFTGYSLPDGARDTYDGVRGDFVQRVGKLVLDGTENWKTYQTQYYFEFKGINISVPQLCTHFVYSNTELVLTTPGYFVANVSNNLVIQYDSGSGGVDNFKSWLAAQAAAGTPVTVYYEIAEPIAYNRKVDITAFDRRTTVTGTDAVDVLEGRVLRVADCLPFEIVRSNRNLLDNPYFTINQRDQKIYSGNYIFGPDRWRLNRISYDMETEEITVLEHAGDSRKLYQTIEAERIGGNIATFSMLLGNNLYTLTSYNRNTLSILDVDIGQLLIYPIENGIQHVELRPDKLPVGSKLPKPYCKLEEGAEQTLAHKIGDQWILNDPPPDPALELLKCQRYFLKTRISRVFCMPVNINGQCALIVPLKLPIAMRLNKPVIEAIEIVDWIHHPNGYYDQNIAIEIATVNGDGNVEKDGNIGLTLALQTPLQNYTDGEFCCIASLKITLSADL